MQSDDRSAIEGLFGRLAEVEARAPSRDQGAEAYIHQRIAAQPAAPYYMAQTIVVQEQALAKAQARIAELEAGEAPRVEQPAATRKGPWGAQQGQAPQQGGGGFLAGAAQTAMGVAGGVLIANAIGGMFGGSAAEAAPGDVSADATAEAAPEATEAAGGEDFAGDDFGGSDFADAGEDSGGGFLDMFGMGDFDV